MDYRQQNEFTPTREVSIFILKNKITWVDIFSGPVSFIYDLSDMEFRCIFRPNKLSQPHVYRLQPKIRRKGPKAFVVRAAGVNADGQKECILAVRFESSSDSFNFQYFMEQRMPTEGTSRRNEANNQQTMPGSSVPPNFRSRYAPHQNGRAHDRTGSFSNSGQHPKYRNLSVKSELTPSLNGSVRSREIPQVNILPLTEENLLLHDSVHRPRPRRVGEVLSAMG